MGLFSKDKITMGELGSTIAKFVFEYQPRNIATYSKLVKEIDNNFNIDDRQKEELLIFDMLVVVRAFDSVFSDSPERNYILDRFHENIYNNISNDREVQEKFEEKVQDRYRAYYDILSSDSEQVMFNFGSQFSSYFFDREEKGQGISLVMASAGIFIETFKIMREMLINILSKYELAT